MSTRRPACAPPPKIWICGSGSSVAVGAAEVALQRHAARPRRRHAPRPSRPRAWRWRRGATCSACRRVRSGARRARPGRRRRGRPRRGRSRRSRGRRRASRRSRRTPRRRRAGRAPRRCRSTRRPARSPGRRRRRRAATSASTVGRPRLSQTRRPCTNGDRGVGHAASSFAQAWRTSPRRSTGLDAATRRAMRRTRSLSGSSVMYSTGDLPSTRARNSPGSRRAARGSSAAGGSQSTPAR